MQYQRIEKGRFLSRPNRFIAHVELDGRTEVVHVKNTGRCRELLIPGATVYLEKSDNPARKTQYDLIAVEKGTLLVNMDAQAPNHVFREWAEAGNFQEGLTLLRPETTWGDSRFDFYWEAGGRRGFVEVKGVTLEEDGHACFPDAPTERGVKHLNELARCQAEGEDAAGCVVRQMAGVRGSPPTQHNHHKIGDALRQAAQAGVRIMARECAVTPDSLTIGAAVPVLL